MEIKLANPQGKGLERISDALQILQEVRVKHKKPIQILRDYCCSLLVLASEFSFLPIPNRYYFLFLLETSSSYHRFHLRSGVIAVLVIT